MTQGRRFRDFFLKLREKFNLGNRGPNFPPPRFEQPLDDLQIPKGPPVPPPAPPPGPGP